MATDGAKERKQTEVREEQSSEQSLIDRIVEEAANRQQTTLIPDQHEWDIYEAMATMSAATPFYGKLGGKNGIMAIMLYAREIGMAPMSALNGGIDNIMGRLAISARSVNEKIRISGHYIQIKSLSADECSIYGKRKDTGEEHIATFTLADAKRSGLFKAGGGYEKNPEDMMFARAISKLGRRLFPDVIKGAYIEGDYHDDSEQTQAQEQKTSEQTPSTIAGMLDKSKHESSKKLSTQEIGKPEKAQTEKPKQETKRPIDIFAPTKSEPAAPAKPQDQSKTQDQPQQEPPKTNGNGDEQAKTNGRKIILDKLSAHFGGDVILINDFLRTSLPGHESQPDMDNIDNYSLSHLKDIHKSVVKLIENSK